MAFADLDAVYKERIANPGLYVPALALQEYLGSMPDRSYGTDAPHIMTRAWYLFGYFDGSSELLCQPVAGASAEIVHGSIFNEIRKEDKLQKRLSFDGAGTVTQDAWSIYVTKNGETQDKIVAYQGIASESHRLLDEKLLAVASATQPGEVLENHIVCARSMYGQKFVIEAGEVTTLRRRLWKQNVRVPYQALAA